MKKNKVVNSLPRIWIAAILVAAIAVCIPSSYLAYTYQHQLGIERDKASSLEEQVSTLEEGKSQLASDKTDLQQEVDRLQAELDNDTPTYATSSAIKPASLSTTVSCMNQYKSTHGGTLPPYDDPSYQACLKR